MTTNIRHQFPMLINHPGLVYLDSANTTLKPRSVIRAVSDYYRHYGANIGRASYQAAAQATAAFSQARQLVADFIGADPDEVVFTASATAGLNQIAFGLVPHLQPGDVILLTLHEHNSNLIPWLEAAHRTGAIIKYIDELSPTEFDQLLPRIKIFAYSSVSNVTGQVYGYADITTRIHQHGGLVTVDATQAAAHLIINIKQPACDFLILSGHKLYGPSGVGVLYIKRSQQDNLQPLLYGSQTFTNVSEHNFNLQAGPAKFEPGTPNIEGVIGLGAAIEFINSYGRQRLVTHDQALTSYFYQQVSQLGLQDYLLDQTATSHDYVGVSALAHPTVHPHDIAMLLDQQQIAVRAGKSCADILLHQLGQPRGVIRASFGIYTTTNNIDRFLTAYQQTIQELA